MFIVSRHWLRPRASEEGTNRISDFRMYLQRHGPDDIKKTIIHVMLRLIKRILIVAIFMGLLTRQGFSEDTAIQDTAKEEPVKKEKGITRPVTRLDARYQFVSVPDGGHQDIYTLRCDLTFKFPERWGLALRGDIPAVYGNVHSGDNKDGDFQIGLGDVLTQITATYNVSDRVALGAGARFLWPSATNEQSGTGKYQALPHAGAEVMIPEISRGSYFMAYVRYAVSYAGDPARNDISRIAFAPTFNFMLPLNIYITLYPSPEIIYDFMQNAWTVPMNFMVGKTFADSVVASVEFLIPMVDDKNYERSYDLKIEARIGFFF
jgi:hypothetical protein